MSAWGEIFDQGIEFRPGFPDLLGSIVSAGLPQVLVTNTARTLVDHCLPVIGEHFFVGSVAGDEVPSGKPAPDGYLKACQLLDCRPDDVLAIEDSAAGMRAARAAGCRVLGVPCEEGVFAPEGVVTIDQLRPGVRDLGSLTPDDLTAIWHELGSAT